MEATLTCTQVEENPLILQLEADTREQLHEQGQEAILAGMMTFVIVCQIMGEHPSECLSLIYDKLGDTTVVYTLLMENGLEDGTCDISPAAIGQHHMRMLDRKPELREVMIRHADCHHDPNCKIRQLYEALELTIPSSGD